MTDQNTIEQQAVYGRTFRGVVSGLVSRAKARARKSGEPFNMTIDSIKELPTICPNPFCRRELEVSTTNGGSDSSYSLDKIDRRRGYDSNWRVCCKRCNRLRADASAAELLGLARWEKSMFPRTRIINGLPTFCLDLTDTTTTHFQIVSSTQSSLIRTSKESS
jgi:hypothetical protein